MATQQPSLPPDTTAEEDRTLAGQRRVNIIWEVTQAIIALVVTIGVTIVAVYSAFSQVEPIQFPTVLSNAFFLIIGFYFSRVNHQAIGGVGPKADAGQVYRGR